MNISPSENIAMAVQTVWAHRFRSFLTILGIVIGITSVVTVASLLSGVREGMVSLFAGLGPDNIFIVKAAGPMGAQGMTDKERRRRPLKQEYAEVIQRWCPATVADVGLQMVVSPMSGAATIAKVPGFESDSFILAGQTANFSSISPRDVLYGRFFAPAEEQQTQRVAVIGINVADALFPGDRPVGSKMMVDGGEYTVVGVFAKAQGGFLGENQQDNLIVIPLKTLRFRYPQLTEVSIVAKARPGLREDALAEVGAAMRRIRQIP
jgi:putative ABC transport system permease protein